MVTLVEIPWWTWGLVGLAGVFLTWSALLKFHRIGACFFAWLTRIVRRPWFEVCLLLFCVGGLVHYGATKGANGADAAGALAPRRTMASAPTVTPEAVDAQGFSLPEDMPPVTNLCFWGIARDADGVSLGLAWPPSLLLTNGCIDLYGHWRLASNGWRRLAVVDVSQALSNAVVTLSSADFPTNAMASSAFFRLATQDDTDGDGLTDGYEAWVLGTDPDLWDTDGDGLADGVETSEGTDPLARDTDGDGLVDGSDPDPHAPTSLADTDGDGLPDVWERHRFGNLSSATDRGNRARCGFLYGTMLDGGIDPASLPLACDVVSTNELVSWKLWDRFTADAPAGGIPVYERTVAVCKDARLPNFYLSSRPDAAGGWRLDGMRLEWEDSSGASGSALSSPAGDSLPLPLAPGVTYVTFRLAPDATRVRSREPVYLIAHSPRIEISGETSVALGDGSRVLVSTNGAETAFDVSADWSRRPCAAEPLPGECDLSALASEMDAEGNVLLSETDDGLKMTFRGPGIYKIPDFGAKAPSFGPRLLASGGGSARGGDSVAVFSPSVSWGEHRCHDRALEWDGLEYRVDDRWPLEEDCLWREWQRDRTGGAGCDCSPKVSTGAGDAPFVRTEVDQVGWRACGRILIGGTNVVWEGSGDHVGEPCLGIGGSGDSPGYDDGQPRKECGCESECGAPCADGDCDRFEGPSLGSFRFRVPTGRPRYGQVSGFVYLSMETPCAISPDAFAYSFRADSSTTVTKSGSSVTVICDDEHGRTVDIDPIPGGARVTVRTTATRALEHTWELWEEGGAIRVRQVSRLDNVMRDETYGYAYDPVADARAWRKTDNVSGVSEELITANGLALSGVLEETRVTRDAGGGWLGTTTRRSVRIGTGDDAVLRETEYLRETPAASAGRRSEYWSDPWHAARNAKLRLRTGDDIPWSYHDWDAEGHEILRIEQRNGSALPETLPLAWTFGAAPSGCEGIEDAFVTVYDYTPSPEDAAHPEDANEMRGEIRYVVRDGVATEIGRTWRTLTRVTRSGYAAVCDERVRACAAGASRGDAGNAYSRTVAFDRSADFDVPLVVRDETAERLDEDGLLTETAVEVAGGRVTLTTRRSRGGVAFPTYDVEVRDATRGTVLLRETRLTAGDAAVASETRAYDEQDRLRSSVWLDGTSATNAFSCCRLLWSRDRQGRTVLRSAVTGEDRLYWADEDVWLADVQTNGHRVTRHFCDGFGRETNTVVCVAAVPGEATNRTSSAQVLSSSTASYADADGNWSETVDARGRRTVTSRSYEPGRSVTETVTDGPGLGEDEALLERRTEWFNGDTSVFTDLRGAWSERFVETDYGADGCRTVTERTVSGTASVTNRVTRYDWLGRRVSVWTQTGETVYSYHGAGNRVDAETLTAGSVTRLRTAVYDACGELVGSAVDGVTEGSETTYEEDAEGCLWRVERETRTSAAGREILGGERRTRLTGLGATEPVPELGVGRLTAETVTLAADGLRTVDWLYAGEGGLKLVVSSNGITGVTRTLRRCGVVIGRETADGAETNACDALGRTILLTRTAGGVTRPVSAYAYTPAGDVASETLFTNDVAGTVTEYAYDAFGNVVATTDALGNVVTNAYDARGNLLATGGAAYAVRSLYDAEGRRLSSATSRNGVAWDATAWEYDSATGLRTAKEYADGTRETRSYTDDGLLLATTSPSGVTRTRAYDARRRLVSVMSPGAAEPDTFAYDAFGRMTAASGTLYGVAALLSDGGVSTNEAVNAAGLQFNLRRELDGCGRVVGRGSSAYVWQTVAYAASGKVASASTPHAAVAYLYDDEGRDAGCEIAVPGAPVFRRAVTRDPWTGRVLAVTNSVGGVPVYGYACAYDALDRLVAKGGETYAYNARGELTARTPAAGAGESYAYDGVGNFTAVSRGGETRAYAANAANQYLSESYDADGRLAASGGAAFAYDAADRLTTVTTGGVWAASYAYDPFGRRIRKLTAEGERWYFYDGWNLVEERVFGSDGSMEIVEYAWGCDASGTLDGAGGVGGLLYVRKHGHVYVPVYDPNGSVTGYVDPSTGALVASYAYDGFGRTVAQSGPMADAFSLRYSTKYMDPETGLSYYGYRYYSPQLGRWLTRDPLEEDGGINLYGFCGNDGVNGVDLLGMLRIRQELVQVSDIGGELVKGVSLGLTETEHGVDISCSCNEQFHGWTVTEVDVFIRIIVHYRTEAYKNLGVQLFAIKCEMEHVADIKAGISHQISPDLAVMQMLESVVPYQTELECRSRNRKKFEDVVDEALTLIEKASILRYDTPGRHTWPLN